MLPRATIVLLSCLVCGGCSASWPGRDREVAPRLPGAPTQDAASATLVVFNDGFHSGFYLPAELVPFEMDYDPRLAEVAPDAFTDPPARSPWVEVGFSNKEWALFEDRGWTKVARLLVAPDDGVLLVRNLDAELYATVRAAGRVWRLDVRPQQLALLRDELLRWLDPAGVSVLGEVSGARAEFYASAYDYAMLSNCHDWSAYMLRCLGLPMPRRWVLTADGFSEDMDALLELVGATAG